MNEGPVIKNAAEISDAKLQLTLSWRKSLSYKNQSTDLLCKSMDYCLYDRDLGSERVKYLNISEQAEKNKDGPLHSSDALWIFGNCESKSNSLIRCNYLETMR